MYHLTTAVNARGQSTGVSYGDKVVASFTYDDATGWLKGSSVNYAPTGATIQLYNYDFDYVGNVKSRQLSYGVGSSANLTETFGYDNLHRLTSRTVNSALNVSGALAMTESYGYDALGNLTSKPGVGNYSFTYDANGNVTNDSKRTFTYTAYEKPSRIQQNNDYTDFEYGPNRELIKRIDKRGNNITSTLMLDGYEQITLPSGVVEHKYSVGDAIITKRSNGANETYYLHKDQQGSTTAITNKDGNTVQQLMYDPWGKQYVVNTSLLTYTSPATSKGYTGHEMVNDFEVIHMGGRTYNPVLGRFMQADPFIQSPTNLQSYNRYSYVLNNPMSYTDPSGYIFKKLFSAIAKVPWLSTVISAAMTIFIPGCQTGLCAAAFNAAMTYSMTGSLRAAGIGFIAGIASGGSMLNDAIIGGIASTMQGGKFGRGFVSAGLGNLAGNAAGGFRGNAFAKVLVAGVLGGTVSKITGDKFANGAFGAAFAAALKTGFEASRRNRGHQLNSDDVPTEVDIELSAQDLKAKEALEVANPKSIEDNLEYGGVIYRLDGEYYYTNPLPGTDQGFNLSNALALVPRGAIVVGDYHTHADYSLYNSDTGQAIRTSDPFRDDFNSDHFSTPDLRGIRGDAGIGGVYRGYLGTPSGRLKGFNPYNNTVYTLGGG